MQYDVKKEKKIYYTMAAADDNDIGTSRMKEGQAISLIVEFASGHLERVRIE